MTMKARESVPFVYVMFNGDVSFFRISDIAIFNCVESDSENFLLKIQKWIESQESLCVKY